VSAPLIQRSNQSSRSGVESATPETALGPNSTAPTRLVEKGET
jgi:hypothetical protein